MSVGGRSGVGLGSVWKGLGGLGGSGEGLGRISGSNCFSIPGRKKMKLCQKFAPVPIRKIPGPNMFFKLFANVFFSGGIIVGDLEDTERPAPNQIRYQDAPRRVQDAPSRLQDAIRLFLEPKWRQVDIKSVSRSDLMVKWPES